MYKPNVPKKDTYQPIYEGYQPGQRGYQPQTGSDRRPVPPTGGSSVMKPVAPRPPAPENK
jgi:hypothetical protein